MRAYVIDTSMTIEPFGDPVGECLICDRPLRTVIAETLRQCGLEPVPGAPPAPLPAPAVVLHDTLFLSPRLLKEFIDLALVAAAGQPQQLWLKKGLYTRLLAPLQEAGDDETALALPLWLLPAGSDPAVATDPAQGIPPRRLTIDVDEDSYEGSFPPHMIGKEKYRFCLTSRPGLAITHPLHLALANQAANFARLAELKKAPWYEKLAILLRARSINKYKILAATSSIHPQAEVHPTAVVEGSVIERGAKVGAYAVIKFSHVGENAFIDDHAGLKFSIVGREAYIANNCVLFFTTVYPRAFLISGPYQFSLFGYDSAMMNAIPADYRFDGQPISVMTRHGPRSTGLRFVGSVIGHRTRCAAGVIIAPGRALPNDLCVHPDPARVLTRVDPTLAGKTVFVKDGRLVEAP